MDVKEFQEDFLQEVKATAATEGEGSSAAFVSIASQYLINSEIISDFSAAFLVKNERSSCKFRVDGYVLDEFDFTFSLFIADYTGTLERPVLSKATAKQLFDKLRCFVEESFGSRLVREVEVSTPAADLIDLLRYHKDRIRKFRFLLLSDGFMSDRISSIETDTINNITVDCQIWDVDRIFRICCSDNGRQNIEIDFQAINGLGIPCLSASSTDTNEYKSYLCIIPGTTLADIYDAYGAQLLEGNVRSFLSTKVAVNKKIRETILSMPEKFFAYNNGVSATAMDLEIDTTPKGSFITFAKDFQIINGGQTTASLSNARHRDKACLDQIYVQMKITEVDSNADKASELIRNISRSSNSQNKVSDADFFSTHPFHVRMEQISRRLFARGVGGSQFDTKWFYERARGQYIQAQMRMSKSERDKFIAQHPQRQMVTKTDFAKARNTWSGAPHVVSKGAQTNFLRFAEITDEAWVKDETVFNEKYFKETIALILLFKHTEFLVSHQTWYEQGYRANIVTYALAFLRWCIKQQFKNKELDLIAIWNRQEIPELISGELVKITKLVFDHITDSNRETINVTQWCKRDSCWTKLKEKKYHLSDNFENLLVSKEEAVATEKEAKNDQALVSEVEISEKVINFGAEFWKKVRDFSISKKIGSEQGEQALKYACAIPDKIPSGFQCIKLLELLEQVRAEGFKGE